MGFLYRRTTVLAMRRIYFEAVVHQISNVQGLGLGLGLLLVSALLFRAKSKLYDKLSSKVNLKNRDLVEKGGPILLGVFGVILVVGSIGRMI